MFRNRDVLIKDQIEILGSVHWITDPDLFFSGAQDSNSKVIFLCFFTCYFACYLLYVHLHQSFWSFFQWCSRCEQNIVFLCFFACYLLYEHLHHSSKITSQEERELYKYILCQAPPSFSGCGSFERMARPSIHLRGHASLPHSHSLQASAKRGAGLRVMNRIEWRHNSSYLLAQAVYMAPPHPGV